MFWEHWRKQLFQITRLDTNDSVSVNRNLIVADALLDRSGFTWTLASVLGTLLALAEERFGRRDANYCLLGVEFAAKGPQVWFPGDKKHIVIQLSLNSLTNDHSALFELSHECVHLLSPQEGRNATVLEEDLATFFSVEQMQKYYGVGWWSEKRESNYFEAATKVEKLLALDSNVICRLRQEESTISLITSEMILRHCPSAPEELAESLATRFVYVNDEQTTGQNAP